MGIFHNKKSKYIQIGVALFLIIVITTGISYVGYLAVFDYGKIPPQEYLTPNTKDTTRIIGDTPQQISMKVSQIMYPSLSVNSNIVSGTNDNSSNNSISSNSNNTNSAITLPFSESNENTINLAFAFAPLSKWENIPLLLTDIDNNNNKNQINFSQSDLLKASSLIDEYIAKNTAAASSYAKNRIILAPIDNPQFSLLAASWSSYSGDPMLFIDNDDSLPEETLQRLEARAASTTAVTMNNSETSSSSSDTINEKDNKKLFIYVVAPSGYISDNVRQQLSKYGDVRIPDLSSDPYTASVRLAQYRDFDSGFGWGMDKSNVEGNSKAGYFNYIIVNPDNIGSGIAALPLSHSAKYGPILFTNNEYIPPILDNYLWSTKADFFMTPAEGPFNHYWIIGNHNSNNNNNDGINYIVQSRFDYGTEIGAYRMQGAGMSSLEALFAGWIAFSIFGMIYVAVSMRKSLQNVSLIQKLAWPLVVLMLGPFGLVAYWLSFNGRRMIEMKMDDNNSKKSTSSSSSSIMIMWERPIWSQSIVATFVAIAFAASTMIATAYLIETFIGLPLQVIDGPFYWFGNGMILTIAISYGVAVVVSLFVFQAPMFAQQRKQPYKKVLKIALIAVLASMTSVSLGMMTLMYFMHMWWLPMVPEEDDLAWFGSMYFSTLIGAVIAMPINYLLIRRGIKVGEM